MDRKTSTLLYLARSVARHFDVPELHDAVRDMERTAWRPAQLKVPAGGYWAKVRAQETARWAPRAFAGTSTAAHSSAIAVYADLLGISGDEAQERVNAQLRILAECGA